MPSTARITPILLLWLLTFSACQNEPASTSPPAAVEEEAPEEAVAEENVTDKGTSNVIGTYYIAAPSGLNLREKADRKSKVLAKMPYGAPINWIKGGESNPFFKVDQFEGNLWLVEYEGQKGYAFNAFLSPLPVPVGYADVELFNIYEYIDQLQEAGIEASIMEPEGEADQLVVNLPQIGVAPAFLIMRRLFDIPDNYDLPPFETEIDYALEEGQSEDANGNTYKIMRHGTQEFEGSILISYRENDTYSGYELQLYPSSTGNGGMEIKYNSWRN